MRALGRPRSYGWSSVGLFPQFWVQLPSHVEASKIYTIALKKYRGKCMGFDAILWEKHILCVNICFVAWAGLSL